MLVVIAFHSGDKNQTIKLAQWIKELESGSPKAHRCLLVVAKDTSADGIIEPLQDVFTKVEVVFPREDIHGWPQGPNSMFDCTLRLIEYAYKCPFLWLEPDAIPLRAGWLNEIEQAYIECKKPFMGDYVDVQREHPEAINHMSGIAVYPANPSSLAPNLFSNINYAWDIVAASQVVPLMQRTPLIQHSWKAESFLTKQSLSRIHKDAVIFHQCKDGSLIDRLKGEPEIILEDKRPIVKTFYDPLKDLQDPELMEMWQKNWNHFGWQTKIVDLQSAEKADPKRFSRYRDSKNLYKGSCGRDYLFRCYARWLCMLEGGFMVDFDVFNYGFTPKIFNALVQGRPKNKVIHLSGDATPCATIGGTSAYAKYVECFDRFDKNPVYSTEALMDNVHDLNIFDANPQVWIGIKICSLYPIEKEWETYPLVHYTHGHTKFPRSAEVPKLRKLEL